MDRLPDSVSAYIFDMDGVIFDSERAVFNEWKLLSEKYNFPNLEEPYMKCIGVNAATCKQIFLDYYGAGFPYDEYCEERRRNYHVKYGHGRAPLKPGIRELLECLKQHDYRIAIASSTRTESVMEHVEGANLLLYFDEIIGGDMVTRSKPNPDIFLKAAERLNTLPENCCVIEDSYNGILAASAAGMFPVMVPDMLPPDDLMREKAGLILNSLTELTDMLNR